MFSAQEIPAPCYWNPVSYYGELEPLVQTADLDRELRRVKHSRVSGSFLSSPGLRCAYYSVRANPTI